VWEKPGSKEREKGREEEKYSEKEIEKELVGGYQRGGWTENDLEAE